MVLSTLLVDSLMHGDAYIMYVVEQTLKIANVFIPENALHS